MALQITDEVTFEQNIKRLELSVDRSLEFFGSPRFSISRYNDSVRMGTGGYVHLDDDCVKFIEIMVKQMVSDLRGDEEGVIARLSEKARVEFLNNVSQQRDDMMNAALRSEKALEKIRSIDLSKKGDKKA